MRLSGRAWLLIAVSVFCFCPIFYEGYRIPSGQVFCSSAECHIFAEEGKLGIVTTPALELVVEGIATWGRSPSDSTASLTVIDITSNGISEHQFPGKSTWFSMVDSRFMTDWADACGERGAVCEWTGERFRAVDSEPRASFKAHHYDNRMFDDINGWTGESLFCPNGEIFRKAIRFQSGVMECGVIHDSLELSLSSGDKKQVILRRDLKPKWVSPLRYLRDFKRP